MGRHFQAFALTCFSCCFLMSPHLSELFRDLPFRSHGETSSECSELSLLVVPRWSIFSRRSDMERLSEFFRALPFIRAAFVLVLASARGRELFFRVVQDPPLLVVYSCSPVLCAGSGLRFLGAGAPSEGIRLCTDRGLYVPHLLQLVRPGEVSEFLLQPWRRRPPPGARTCQCWSLRRRRWHLSLPRVKSQWELGVGV